MFVIKAFYYCDAAPFPTSDASSSLTTLPIQSYMAKKVRGDDGSASLFAAAPESQPEPEIPTEKKAGNFLRKTHTGNVGEWKYQKGRRAQGKQDGVRNFKQSWHGSTAHSKLKDAAAASSAAPSSAAALKSRNFEPRKQQQKQQQQKQQHHHQQQQQQQQQQPQQDEPSPARVPNNPLPSRPHGKPVTRLTPRGARLYDTHWTMEEMQKGLKEGTLHEGIITFNPANRKEAFAKIVGLLMEVLIVGLDQNRAFEGDKVAICLYPYKKWPRLKQVEDPIPEESTKEETEPPPYNDVTGRIQYSYETLIAMADKFPRQPEEHKRFLEMMTARMPASSPLRINLKGSNESDMTESTSSPAPSPYSSPRPGVDNSNLVAVAREGGEAADARLDRFKRPQGYVVGILEANHLKRTFKGRMAGNPDGNRQLRQAALNMRNSRNGMRNNHNNPPPPPTQKCENPLDEKPHPVDKTALFIPYDPREPKFIIPIEYLPADWVTNFEKYRNAEFVVKVDHWNENISYPHGIVASFTLPDTELNTK